MTEGLAGWLDAAPAADVALRFEGRDITYGTLEARAGEIAGSLHALGIRHGDRVAMLGANTPDFLALVFACARLGGILVPLNWRLAAPEHAVILGDAEPALLLHDDEFAGAAAAIRCELPGLATRDVATLPPGAIPATAGRSEDAVLIVYTSGTTGRPKGAVLTQAALAANAVNSQDLHGFTRDDRVLTFLPMFHVGGLNIQTLPALRAGATVVLQRRFQPDAALAALAAEHVTVTLVVPAVMRALVDHPGWAGADLSSLRMVGAGSSIIPLELIRAFHARGLPVCQIYGSTETAPTAIVLTPADAFRKEGSAGLPARLCAAKIVDPAGTELPPGEPGEILVRGPNLMRGYWRALEATEAALASGWFHTGDIGHRDAEGFFWVADRKNDLIISGGENVYPAEVEAVLLECPDVADCAVVARPDRRWGEVPVAVVVRRPGTRLGEAAARRLFEGRLARFKHPQEFHFVERLPRNAMGKVLRFRLRDALRAGRPLDEA
jgi:fatty-acyl-CoA synthase